MTRAKWVDLPKYPVTAGIAALAVAATLAWWAKVDVSILFETADIRRGQLWRLFTSMFLHLDILHLLFNIWWLWIFGTQVERILGHAKTALLVLLFAVGSGSLDFALSHGGVGLSGVGYGFFGLLWVLSKKDDRFRGALEPRTVSLFVGWFFLCIFTTLTGMYRVANVAHGGGALLGVLVGYGIALPRMRVVTVAASSLLCTLGILGSTIGRPYINLSHNEGYQEAKWGYDALLVNDDRTALRWLKDAARYQPRTPEVWYDLGIAYQRAGDLPAAKRAYERAHELAPGNTDYTDAAKSLN